MCCWRWSRAAGSSSRLNPLVDFAFEPANSTGADLDALRKAPFVFQSLKMNPAVGDPLETLEIVIVQETQPRRRRRSDGLSAFAELLGPVIDT
jgi:hypothetical protein